MAFSSGFDRLNIDLMYGLENQTRSEAIADIETALALACHTCLGINSRSSETPRFGQSHRHFPMQMWLNLAGRVRELLGNSDIHQYEVSAWSREGEESRHNLNYWRFGDYLAIGAGAHGKVSVDNRVTDSSGRDIRLITRRVWTQLRPPHQFAHSCSR